MLKAVTGIDVCFLIIFLLSVFIGGKIGVMGAVRGILSTAVAFYGAVRLLPLVQPLALEMGLSPVLAPIIAFVLLFILLKFVSRLVLNLVSDNMFGVKTVNQFLGSLMGAVSGILIVALLCVGIYRYAPRTGGLVSQSALERSYTGQVLTELLAKVDIDTDLLRLGIKN